MPRQSEAFYDNGDALNPGDSEKHIFAQIASNTQRLNGIGGPVGVDSAQYSETTPPAIKTADGDVANLQLGERLIIQNLATTALHVRYGGTASTTQFHFIIPACTATDDGSVPPYIIDNWKGTVSVKAATGSPRFTWSKLNN